jgi:hypothetical protein
MLTSFEERLIARIAWRTRYRCTVSDRVIRFDLLSYVYGDMDICWTGTHILHAVRKGVGMCCHFMSESQNSIITLTSEVYFYSQVITDFLLFRCFRRGVWLDAEFVRLSRKR